MSPKFLISLIFVDIIIGQAVGISRVSSPTDTADFFYGSFIAANYLFVLFLLYLERSRLIDFGIERYALLIFTLSCFLWVRFLVAGEVWFYLVLAITGLITAFLIYKIWGALPKSSIYMVGVALNFSLWGCIFLVLAQYMSGYVTLNENAVEPLPLVTVLINRSIAAISSSSTIMQLLLRGFLWGYMLKSGIKESHVFWIITIGTSIMYWPYLQFPAIFAALYLLNHSSSYLRRSSTQLFPSMVFNTIVIAVSESVIIMLRWAR
jgi:hypothetical protein